MDNKDNNNKSNTDERGLFSNLMGYGYGGGHHYPPYSAPCYPPAAYPYPSPHGGYVPTAYPPSAYSHPYHSGYGAHTGVMLGGGAGVYGAHHLTHGHHGHGHYHHYGHGYHGKFGKRWKHHGFFGRHKFKKWWK